MIIINTPHDADILYKNLKKTEKKYFEEKKNSIINNVFLDKKYVEKFRIWIKHNNKIISIIKRFYNSLKRNYTYNKLPENEEDLTCDIYDKKNKNIYIYDFKNKRKWWFSIKNIYQLINNSLCYFDTDMYSLCSKYISNPYTGERLSYQTILSIYNQLRVYTPEMKGLLQLFKYSNFNLNILTKRYDFAINDYGAKNILSELDEIIIIELFINMINSHNIKYVSHSRLEYYYPIIKYDLIDTLKICYLSHKTKTDKVLSIRCFVNKHKYIMRRALHTDSDEINNDSELDDNNSVEDGDYPILNNSPRNSNDNNSDEEDFDLHDSDIEITTSVIVPESSSISFTVINNTSNEILEEPQDMELSDNDTNQLDCNENNCESECESDCNENNCESECESDCNENNCESECNKNNCESECNKNNCESECNENNCESECESECNENNCQLVCNESSIESDYESECNENTNESYKTTSDSEYDENAYESDKTSSDSEYGESCESVCNDYEDSRSVSSFNTEWEELSKDKYESEWDTDSESSKLEKMSLEDN